MPEFTTVSLKWVSAENSAHKSRFILYGFLSGLQLILFIYLISIFFSGGNQTCSSEQGKTPISEKPEGPSSERQTCVPCKTLPPSLREPGKSLCCTRENFPLEDLVTAYVDTRMVSRLQADETRDRDSDFHTNMKNVSQSGKIVEWRESPVGSPNNTHLRIGKSGYYFVSTDISFDFKKSGMESITMANFSVMHLKKVTGQTSPLFLSHSVPICVKDGQPSNNCIVPNEVGGIQFLEEEDLLFVETDCLSAVCPSSTSFGFQMISPGPL